MKSPVYIFGHRHPDTDSIASAIAYAFYQRALGVNAIACRLGEINAETKYLLDRFGFEEPVLLEDARNTLGEIDLDTPISIPETCTIQDAVNTMKDTGRPSLCVTDQEGRLCGIVSRSDLTMLFLDDTSNAIELIRQTGADNICRTVNGTMVYNAENPHTNGKISIIALSESKLDNYEVSDRIVIIGNDPVSMITLIEKGAGMIIAVWTDTIAEEVLTCAKEHQCSVIISGHGSMNTSRFIYFAAPVNLIMTRDVLCFHKNDIAENTGRKLMQTRFRQYPVLDEDNRPCGFISRYHILNYTNKKVILVDHNEFSQSVKAIEKAQLLEVIDHHRINDFITTRPIAFRSEIVGSAATIIASIFNENQIPIPSSLAGLLLGAVLSDTMNFQSPTTTDKDHRIANILAALADLDLEEFGRDLFTAQAADLSEDMKKLIDRDIKYFELPDTRLMISQIVVSSTKDILDRKEEIEKEAEEYAASHSLDLLIIAYTSVLENGSVLFYGGDKEKAEEILSEEERNHAFMEGLLSRKKQILPMILEKAS